MPAGNFRRGATTSTWIDYNDETKICPTTSESEHDALAAQVAEMFIPQTSIQINKEEINAMFASDPYAKERELVKKLQGDLVDD